MLAVSENSDQLPTILRALQQLHVLQEQERQERWQLLRYPLTIAGFALAVFLATTILLVPLFRRLYLAQGDELFWLSASLLQLSDSLQLQPLPWLASLLTFALITISVHRKISISQILNWLPWLGRLQQTVQIQLYSQALALMTKVELPLLEALELASPLLPKSLLTRQLRIQQSLLQGRKLYQAYQEANILAPEQLRLLDLGESSEQIAYAFQRIANYQLQQIQRDRQRLQDFLQPFFMVFVALMVRALRLALYMPLFRIRMTVLKRPCLLFWSTFPNVFLYSCFNLTNTVSDLGGLRSRQWPPRRWVILETESPPIFGKEIPTCSTASVEI